MERSRYGIPALFLIFTLACDEPIDTDRFGQCGVQDDQKKTFVGQWPTSPIQLAFYQGDFTEEEMAAMIQAADSWNEYFKRTIGYPLIDYGTQEDPKIAIEKSEDIVCEENNVGADGVISNTVVVSRIDDWQAGDDIIATTQHCLKKNEPFSTVLMAKIDINYTTFFNEDQRIPDLRTTLLHELGHLVGLGHSCEFDEKDGVPNCMEADIDREYLHAVMFPVQNFDNETKHAHQKHTLGLNDEIRTDCVYNYAWATIFADPDEE